MKTYNAVYSVKGGCGKTAFSIMLAKYLADKKKIYSNDKKVCLIDTDILGSSMLNTFNAINDENKIPKFLNEVRYINDVVDMGKISDYSDFFVDYNILEDEQYGVGDINEDKPVKEKSEFDIIFGSPKYKDIDRYRINSANEFIPDVLHNTFKASFSSFLNNKVCFKKVEDIVFDMPPSADGFSNTVFDCIFGKDTKKYKIGKDEDIRNLFFVMNLDSGHILSAIRELERISTETEMQFPDNVFFVINDMTGYMSNGIEKRPIYFNVHKIRKDIISSAIKEKISLNEDEYNSIKFIYMDYNIKYFEAVVLGKGLANSKLSNVFNGVTFSWEDLLGEKKVEEKVASIIEDTNEKEKEDILYKIIRKNNKGDKKNGEDKK